MYIDLLLYGGESFEPNTRQGRVTHFCYVYIVRCVRFAATAHQGKMIVTASVLYDSWLRCEGEREREGEKEKGDFKLDL